MRVLKVNPVLKLYKGLVFARVKEFKYIYELEWNVQSVEAANEVNPHS